MKAKELCYALLGAESEADVDEIISKDKALNDKNNWLALDGNEINYNIVTNQAASGGKAATEIMTNMVDAILMRHAQSHGITHDSSDCPKSMYDAVDSFVQNLQGGKLINADRNWLKDYSKKNLVVGVTGNPDSKLKTKSSAWPCYTFVDNGEGQHPDDFPKTFLSFKTGIKKAIPFVQGKYNMGSSGVLNYCGSNWYKLIVSRKWTRKGKWGWTLIRRRPGDAEPIAEYFVYNGKIPSFQIDSIWPLHKMDGSRYEGVCAKSGTIVKLYDFYVGKAFKTFKGAREAFLENLVETILPFQLMDFRYESGGTTQGKGEPDQRPFYGMEYLLIRTHGAELDEDADSLERKRIHVGTITDARVGVINISAIPLEKDAKKHGPAWLKYSNNRVFHAVNGQVQFKQTRGFLSGCRLSALKDRVVIVVDSTGLTSRGHADIWKGDRENIVENAMGARYKELVQDAITNSEPLRTLQTEITKEELRQIATTETADLFQKLIQENRDFINLLDNIDPTLHLPDVDNNGGQSFEGRYDPTFLNIKRPKGVEPLGIAINRTGTVMATTDASNDFLLREDNRGSLYLSNPQLQSMVTIRHVLKDGQLTVFMTPGSENTELVGKTVEFEVGLNSPTMPQPLKATVAVQFLAEDTTPKKKKKKKKKTPVTKDKPNRSLPPCKLLTKDGREVFGSTTEKWPDDFDETEGGYIRDLGDSKIYYINFDNTHHIRYRAQCKSDIERDFLSQKFILVMRVLMLSAENALTNTMRRMSEVDGGDDKFSALQEIDDEVRQAFATACATSALWVSDAIPRLVSSEDAGDIE